MKNLEVKIQKREKGCNLPFGERQGHVCFLVWVFTIVFWLGSISPLVFGEPLRVGSAEFRDLPSALKAARGCTVVIETPQTIRANLTVPADVHLLFQDRGRLVRAKDAKDLKVTIKDGLTAPIRAIFTGFQPGKISYVIYLPKGIEMVGPVTVTELSTTK